jgi:hypothetical protein
MKAQMRLSVNKMTRLPTILFHRQKREYHGADTLLFPSLILNICKISLIMIGGTRMHVSRIKYGLSIMQVHVCDIQARL